MSVAQAELPLESTDTFDVGPARVEIMRTGRHVTGSVILARRNAKGRSQCLIDYSAPRDWTSAEERLALECAVCWFAHIGGIAVIQHRHLCHLVQVHRQDPDRLTADWICAAIRCYAKRDWNRTERVWMRLGRWVKERLAVDLEDSPEFTAYLKSQGAIDDRPPEAVARGHAPPGNPVRIKREPAFERFGELPAEQWPDWARAQFWLGLPIYRQRAILRSQVIGMSLENNLLRKPTAHELEVLRAGSQTAVERLGKSCFAFARHICEIESVRRYGVSSPAQADAPPPPTPAAPKSGGWELTPVDWASTGSRRP